MRSTNQAITFDQIQQYRWYLIVRPISMGILVTWVLYAIYVGLLSVFGSFSVAIRPPVNIGQWMIPLLFGIGLQVTLYFYAKGFNKLKEIAAVPKRRIITSIGLSGSAIIACCALYAAGVVPVLWISTMLFSFSQQQISLMIVGTILNAFGIIYLLRFIHQNGFTINNGNLEYFSYRPVVILYSIVFLFISILLGITIY